MYILDRYRYILTKRQAKIVCGSTNSNIQKLKTKASTVQRTHKINYTLKVEFYK